jgi:nicotinamidase-related amidase
MTITTLDTKTALIVVDLQKGALGVPTLHPMDEVVENSRLLAAAFRSQDLPVVFVRVVNGVFGRSERVLDRSWQSAPDWADLAPGLDRKETDLVVTKQVWNAFYGTDLELLLRRRAVTQVVLTGIATSFGVESTARAAHDRGYNVAVATDAVTDLDEAMHRNTLDKVLPFIGETGTTGEILALLG